MDLIFDRGVLEKGNSFDPIRNRILFRLAHSLVAVPYMRLPLS